MGREKAIMFSTEEYIPGRRVTQKINHSISNQGFMAKSWATNQYWGNNEGSSLVHVGHLGWQFELNQGRFFHFSFLSQTEVKYWLKRLKKNLNKFTLIEQ